MHMLALSWSGFFWFSLFFFWFLAYGAVEIGKSVTQDPAVKKAAKDGLIDIFWRWLK